MICCVYRRGNFFWGKLQLDQDAKVSRFSLGTTDRRIAQANLLERAKERQMEHAGLLAPESVRDAAHAPILSHMEAFLDHATQHRDCRPATVAKYRSNISSCIKACGWRYIRDVTARSFCEWRAMCGLSRKSVNDTLAALQCMCRWMVAHRLVVDSPLAHVQGIKHRDTDAQYRRSLSSVELEKLLSVAPPNRRAIYLTAAYTGLRRTELSSLRWSDIVLESALLRVRAATAKNRRDAVLPLPDFLVTALRQYRPENAAPFTPVFRFIPRVSTLRRDLVAAALPFLDQQGRRADFHSLRVTYGTNLTLSGAAPRVVMELMRHSDIKLTMKIYTDAGKLPLADAVAKLPEVVCPETCPETCPNGGLEQSTGVAS